MIPWFLVNIFIRKYIVCFTSRIHYIVMWMADIKLLWIIKQFYRKKIKCVFLEGILLRRRFKRMTLEILKLIHGTQMIMNAHESYDKQRNPAGDCIVLKLYWWMKCVGFIFLKLLISDIGRFDNYSGFSILK